MIAVANKLVRQAFAVVTSIIHISAVSSLRNLIPTSEHFLSPSGEGMPQQQGRPKPPQRANGNMTILK